MAMRLNLKRGAIPHSSNYDPQYGPERVQIRRPNMQRRQNPRMYDPPVPSDYVSRESVHDRAFTLSIGPWLSVARWPFFPMVKNERTQQPGVVHARGRWKTNQPRRNIVRRPAMTYGALRQLYPHLDFTAE
jgi:hypothetical protein